MASLLNMSGSSLLNKGLPYDAEIEYLESSGTQYINTGIIADMNYVFNITFMPKESTQAVIFGCQNRSGGYPGILLNDIGTFRYGTQQPQSISPTLSQNINYNCSLSYKKLTVNGVDFQATGITVDTSLIYTIYLFARNNVGSVGNQSKCRIYRFSATVRGVLLRDFIPVRIGQVGYMYDKVSGQLFGNAGTGSFILGNDI